MEVRSLSIGNLVETPAKHIQFILKRGTNNKGMTKEETRDVEIYFKEWGSICRGFSTKEKPIYRHFELLQFAEDYHKHKLTELNPPS